jgi:hypothetical protein
LITGGGFHLPVSTSFFRSIETHAQVEHPSGYGQLRALFLDCRTYFTNSISVGRRLLSKNNSFWLYRRRNILHPQSFDWNAKPLPGGAAFRKQRNM